MGQEFAQELFSSMCRVKKEGGDAREFLNDAAERTIDLEDRLYALSLLAIECQSKKDFVGAESALTKRVEIDPAEPSCWVALARFYASDKGDEAEALRCIERAVSPESDLSSTFIYAQVERARIAVLLQRPDMAEDALTKIKAVGSPDPSEAWQLDGTVVPGLKKIGVRPEVIDEYVALIQKKTG